MTKEIGEEWLNKEMGVIKQGDTRLFDEDRVDIPGLRDKLDNIVSDPRKMEFITKTIGPEKAKQMKDLHKVTGALDKFTKSIKKKDAGRGEVSTAYDEMGFTKPLRTAKIIKDYIYDSGKTGAYSEEVMGRLTELIKRTQTDNAVEKSRAAEELYNFVEHKLSKDMGRISPTAIATDNSGELVGGAASAAGDMIGSGYNNITDFIKQWENNNGNK